MLKQFITLYICFNLLVNLQGQTGLYLPLDEGQRLDLDYSFYEAIRNKMLGNYDQAVKDLDKCLSIYPKHHASLFLLGSLCLDRKELSRSIQYLNQAIKLDSRNLDYWNKLIEAYKISKNFVQIAKAYDQLIEYYPARIDFYKNAASFWQNEGKNEKAIKIYKKAEKQIGISENISLELERLYLSVKKPHLAVRQLNKLVQSDPSNLKYQGLLADLYLDLGLENDAKAIYNNILQIDSINGLANLALAEIALTDKDKSQYIYFVSKSFRDEQLNLKTKLSVLQENINGTLSVTLTNDELNLLFQQLRNMYGESSEINRLQGFYYYKHSKWNQAKQFYTKCYDLKEITEDMLLQLVSIDYKTGDMKSLLKHTKTGIDNFSYQPLFYHYHAISLYKTGGYDSSINTARYGIELVPFEPLIITQLLVTMGNAALISGNISLADSSFNAAYEIDSMDRTVISSYAMYLAQTGKDLDRAEQMALSALTWSPENDEYADIYGWVLFKQGKYELADQYLNGALNKNPDNPIYFEHCGDNQWNLGNRDNALKLWRTAVEKGLNSPTLLQKIKENHYIK